MLSYTDNNALTHSTTGCGRVDFFFKVTRDTNKDDLYRLLEQSWRESHIDSLKLIFHLRDCRGGKGEKKQFHNCLLWLLNKSVDDLKINLPNVPFFGYYKDLLVLLGTDLEDQVLDIFASRLMEDKKLLVTDDKYNITLVAKWAPTEGCSYDRQFSVVKKLTHKMNITNHVYRKYYLVPLREHLRVVEQQMCAGKWKEIDFSKIPSVALFRYKKAFKKHCSEQYQEFLNKVKSHQTKMNTGQLQPHEILSSYFTSLSSSSLTCPIDETLEITWQQYINQLKSKTRLRRSLAVVDVSGSMSSNNNLPYRVAISLGLIIAEMNEEPFNRKWITFSDSPSLETITGASVHEQINNMLKSHWSMNTNVQAVFDLILNCAKMHQLQPDQMIETIYILSDMQFDTACRNNDKTNLEVIDEKYKLFGYKRPTIIFWSIDSKKIDFPATMNEQNVALISGFSPDLLNLIVAGDNISPYNMMRKAIDNQRYNVIKTT